MLLVTAESGRVGHVVSEVVSGGDVREVKTVCGKAYPEYSLTANTDYDNICKPCEGKSDIDLDAAPVLESTTEEPVVEEEPASTSKTTTSKK